MFFYFGIFCKHIFCKPLNLKTLNAINKIIINFCQTGMIPTKEITPFVSITPSEIIEQTHEAYELGITIAHLHARLDNGVPTYKSNIR
ncbi:3-keto-5-aminohexanoate cleavage protein [Winogradskyella sp.]|uniref:3-keto-5-aminohexanoate cleavage protein n=1 Tax=Winogradskyella sp. TaxID=1883156 RepID=UPI003F6AF9A5